MPLSLHDSQINGGTFNNVAGNMSQVFHSHAVRIEGRAGPRLVGDADIFLPSLPPSGSTGAIRQQRASGDLRSVPYAVTNRRHREEEPPPFSDTNSSGSMHITQQAIPYDYARSNQLISAFNPADFAPQASAIYGMFNPELVSTLSVDFENYASLAAAEWVSRLNWCDETASVEGSDECTLCHYEPPPPKGGATVLRRRQLER
ncbi:hypothetical protein MVEN_02559800 [Mycena venus]|uniref:Uncharacterized protein n=1 Tax=Mycena venus TaxID=2733690 RepID=A0A8H6WSP3_9AGAR|nr:hypothetical protein MVEN_02559800 [Mycena venus]